MTHVQFNLLIAHLWMAGGLSHPHWWPLAVAFAHVALAGVMLFFPPKSGAIAKETTE